MIARHHLDWGLLFLYPFALFIIFLKLFGNLHKKYYLYEIKMGK